MVRTPALVLSALIGAALLGGLRPHHSVALPAAAGTPVEVRVNGRLLGHGVLVAQGGSREAWLRVSDLERAISGSAPAAGQLRLAGTSLYATAAGGCRDCLLHVIRPVLITERVRIVGGAPHLPLEDLARALEAKLGAEAGGSVYNLYVGACHWCILAPALAASAS